MPVGATGPTRFRQTCSARSGCRDTPPARCAASARTGRPRAFAGPRRTRADGPPPPLLRLPSPPERQYLRACVASPDACDRRSARLRVAVRICAPWPVPTTLVATAAVASLPGHDDRSKARLLTAAVAKARECHVAAVHADEGDGQPHGGDRYRSPDLRQPPPRCGFLRFDGPLS